MTVVEIVVVVPKSQTYVALVASEPLYQVKLLAALRSGAQHL